MAEVRNSLSIRRGAGAAAALSVAGLLMLVPVGGAWGATTINGPIDLGTAAPFGVLGAEAVDNTGASLIDGDVGVSPGTALDGFPPGLLVAGHAFHATDPVADGAQDDLDDAMLVAASLSPNVSGLANLTGMTLVPGVYKGGALLLDGAGTLTLEGGPNDVWVFTASSTLITGSSSRIALTGGASACNVFWRIGSSATFGTATDFAGTVMAEESITATTGTRIAGRLLAANGTVTLDTTTVTDPAPCIPAGTTSMTDDAEFTSGDPDDGTEGTPYAHTFTTTGAPTIDYEVTDGALPEGLTLDPDTGELSGTPTTPGTTTFEVTAGNGSDADAIVIVTIVIAAAAAPSAALLPPTGVEPVDLLIPTGLISLGILFVAIALRRAQSPRAL